MCKIMEVELRCTLRKASELADSLAKLEVVRNSSLFGSNGANVSFIFSFLFFFVFFVGYMPYTGKTILNRLGFCSMKFS